MKRSWIKLLTVCAVLAFQANGLNSLMAQGGNGCWKTPEPSQMLGLNGFSVEPVFTVGESLNGYTPPGILDGIGAFRKDSRTIRLLVNNELSSTRAYPYSLANGTQLTGGRVSFFDIDQGSLGVCNTGLAFDTIYNRAGEVVESASDLEFGGLNRLCSSAGFKFLEYGLLDNLYFTGEESSGGTEFVLDVAKMDLWAAPALGRAAWENVTLIDTGRWYETAVIVGDDRAPAPLILFVGIKKPFSANILARNGLDHGKLYVWVADSGVTTPEQFNGTGGVADGEFVEIDYYRPDLASADGSTGYGPLGYATQDKQDELASAAGAFLFSRPEDVATNPKKGGQFAMASTGRGQLYPSDNWGTIYTIKTKFKRIWYFWLSKIEADATIIYDGDDADKQDFGIRSPDNMDWADDGFIYAQEDRSTSPGSAFGGTSGEEASIWRLSPNFHHNGQISRVGQIDRTAVPAGQTDPVPNEIGNWESSGILDVSTLFGRRKGTLFVGDVQAHSLRDGIIADENLAEGGQLFFMTKDR